MASLWGIYGFMGFWSGQLIPIAINIPGRLNCRNVKGKFRNISTFQTHEPVGLQMWGKRGVLWKKKKVWKNKQNLWKWMKNWVRTGLGDDVNIKTLLCRQQFPRVFIHITVPREPYLLEVQRPNYLPLWYRVSTGRTIHGKVCCCTLHTAGLGNPSYFHYKG